MHTHTHTTTTAQLVLAQAAITGEARGGVAALGAKGVGQRGVAVQEAKGRGQGGVVAPGVKGRAGDRGGVAVLGVPVEGAGIEVRLMKRRHREFRGQAVTGAHRSPEGRWVRGCGLSFLCRLWFANLHTTMLICTLGVYATCYVHVDVHVRHTNFNIIVNWLSCPMTSVLH